MKAIVQGGKLGQSTYIYLALFPILVRKIVEIIRQHSW